MSKEYLDRKEVEGIINKNRDTVTWDGSSGFSIKSIDKIITQICQLQPKNQVVVVEGKIRKDRFYHCCINGRNIGIYFEELVKKLDGKKVKIILEVANEKSRRSYKDVKLHILDSPNRKK